MAPVLFDPLMIPVLQGGAEPDPANPSTPLMDPGGAVALSNGYQLTDGVSVFTLINGSTRLTQRINAGETTLAQWSTGTKPPFSNDGPLPPPPTTGGTTTGGTGTGTGTGTGGGGGGTGASTAATVPPVPSTFQSIRGTLEKSTLDALTGGGMTATDVFFDNVGESRPSADSTWAQISISFTDVKQDLIGCCDGEDIRGTVQCNIYTPAGQGSSAGENYAAAVLRAWSDTAKWNAATGNRVRCRNLEGPRRVNTPTNEPHACHVVTAAFAGTAA
jgi:hypothetical protein